MITTNISKLSFSQIAEELGSESFNMHYDSSDALRTISNEQTFENVKSKLIDSYGDVTVTINKDEYWFNQVKILDDAWNKAHSDYCSAKQAWCDKYGCD